MTPAHRSRPTAAVRIGLASIALVSITTLIGATHSSAHSPHDDVEVIEFVPDASPDGMVFAVVRGRLMRSSDRGESWTEVVNGLRDDIDPLRLLAFSRGDGTVGYAVSTSGAVFRTGDSGTTWSAIGEVRPRVRHLRVSPGAPDVVLALGVRDSYRSADGGRTWEAIAATGGPIVDATFLGDGDRVIGADAGGHAVVSDDGGVTWSTTAALDGLDVPVVVEVVLTVDAARPIVYVGDVDGAMMRSDDGGLSFERVGVGLPSREIRSIAAAAGAGTAPILWLTTWSEGPFRSTDLGATWTTWADGTTTDDQAIEKREPDWNVVAAAPDGSGTVLLGGFDGLFALDGVDDADWRPIETLDRYVAGLDVSPDFADDGVVIVTSYIRGAFRSDDGGDSWIPVNRGLDFPDNPSSAFPVWRLHNVHISPDYATDRTVFSSTWLQVVRSSDGGRSWERINLPREPDGTRPRLFVIGMSPDFGDDATVYAGTESGVVYRSTTGGDPGSWRALGTLPSRVRSLAVAPATDGGRTLLAGTAEQVHLSTDGGATWRRVAPEISADPLLGVQVMLSPNFVSDGTALAAATGGLFFTRDGGRTWTRSTGLEVGPVEAAAFSPAYADDLVVLASVRGHGLRRSTDGGVTFDTVADGLVDANLLIADYSVPTSNPIRFSPAFAVDRTVFAYAEQEVIRSTDGGESWEILEFPTSADVRAALIAEQSDDRGRALVVALVAAVLAAIALGGSLSITVDRRRRRRTASGA